MDRLHPPEKGADGIQGRRLYAGSKANGLGGQSPTLSSPEMSGLAIAANRLIALASVLAAGGVNCRVSMAATASKIEPTKPSSPVLNAR